MRKGDFQNTLENLQAGQIVKRYRTALKLTQAEFGRYLQTRFPNIDVPSQPTISAWEDGKATVPAPLIVVATLHLGPDLVAQIIADADAGFARLTRIKVSYLSAAA